MPQLLFVEDSPHPQADSRPKGERGYYNKKKHLCLGVMGEMWSHTPLQVPACVSNSLSKLPQPLP